MNCMSVKVSFSDSKSDKAALFGNVQMHLRLDQIHVGFPSNPEEA
jgi:hypothetical protein